MDTEKQTSTAIVVTGGSPPDPRVVSILPSPDFVVCADSGFDHALALGFTVDALVGDLDSISSDGLARADALGVPITTASPSKDETDTELAFVESLRLGASAIVLLTGGGDRIDHLLGVIAALGHHTLDGLERLEAWIGSDHLAVARPHRPLEFDRSAGSTFSLLPLGGPAVGVRASGLEWTLSDDTLDPGQARGVSNRVTSSPISISLDSGVLAVITPGLLDSLSPKGGPT